MPFQIVRNDITKMKVDAIVNAANSSLLGGGGVDGAIHRVAGPQLLEECRTLGGCRVGEAKRTAAYRLPCRCVIHTVGPRWHGGGCGEEQALRACYRASLALAKESGCDSLAFPLISAGAYGYPRDEAARIASEEIRAFLENEDMTVYLVVFGSAPLNTDPRLLRNVQAYLDGFRPKCSATQAGAPRDYAVLSACKAEATALPPLASCEELDRRMDELDESFQEALLRTIDERGLSDVQCYKKANIDRRLFSKIRGDRLYRPSKATVLAFAIALELNLRETESLLRKAGFALSQSSRFDVIVRYFIERGEYDIFAVNEVLFHYDQPLLGS